MNILNNITIFLLVKNQDGEQSISQRRFTRRLAIRELALARRLDTPCKDVVKRRREGCSSADILIELVISKQKVKGTSAPSFQTEITQRIDVLARVLVYSP